MVLWAGTPFLSKKLSLTRSKRCSSLVSSLGRYLIRLRRSFAGLANEVFLGRTREEMQLLTQEFQQRSKAVLVGAARLIASETSVEVRE